MSKIDIEWIKSLLDFVTKVHTPHASDPCNYHEPANTITWKSVMKSVSDNHQLFFSYMATFDVPLWRAWRIDRSYKSHMATFIIQSIVLPTKKFLT